MSTMTNKNKIETNSFADMADMARNAGLIIMAMAATAGLIETPEHHEKRALLATQPAYAFNGSQSGDEQNPQRREREESGPHYISYGTAQRTPGRTGKI